VTEPPVPVTQRRATVPPPLAQLIMRCLAKKPADRPQTADELLPILESFTTPSGGITPTQTQPVEAVRRLPRWMPWVGGLAALAVVGLVASQFLRTKQLNVVVSGITPVTSEPGVEFQPALSPDGKEVAYVAGAIGAPHLVIKSTAGSPTGGQVRLTDTTLLAEWYPSWSSDGQFVRFLACRADGCSRNESDRLGGAERSSSLPPRARTSATAAWSPDGNRIAFVAADAIFVTSMHDDSVHRIAVHTVAYWSLHSLAWSPDGRRIAYVNGNPLWRFSGNVAPSSIWIVDAAGGEPQRVTTDEHLNMSPAWLDDRHVLFVSNRDGPRGVYLVEVGPDGARGVPRAIPGVAEPHSISYATGDRMLAYAKLTLRQNIWSYPLGRPAPISIRDGRPVTSGNQVVETADVSPDGRWLVFDSNIRGTMDLYRMSLVGGQIVPLTDYPGDEFEGRWSPDGREIAFYNDVATSGTRTQGILVVPAAGGEPTVLFKGPPHNNYPIWSPSGLDIEFLSTRTRRNEIWILSRDSVGGAWHAPVQLTDFGAFPLHWTPDGTGVLAISQGTLIVVSRDKRILWRRDLAATDGLALTGLPTTTAYSRDGRTIYLGAAHRNGRRGIWAIPVAGGRARQVIAFDDPALIAAFGGCVSVGVDRLYLTVSQYESDIWVANLRW
jgi:Tol biopolymer transport system component